MKIHQEEEIVEAVLSSGKKSQIYSEETYMREKGNNEDIQDEEIDEYIGTTVEDWQKEMGKWKLHWEEKKN